MRQVTRHSIMAMDAPMNKNTSEPLATLSPSPVRRYLATGTQFALGVVLLYAAINSDGTTVMMRLVLAGIGVFVLLNGMRLYRATGTYVVLTEAGLFDGNGKVLAKIENIRRVERGVLAFKPSQGFLVLTHNREGRHWAPGLWWRFGKNLGIGGVTNASEGKFMAERIAFLLTERQVDKPTSMP